MSKGISLPGVQKATASKPLYSLDRKANSLSDEG